MDGQGQARFVVDTNSSQPSDGHPSVLYSIRHDKIKQVSMAAIMIISSKIYIKQNTDQSQMSFMDQVQPKDENIRDHNPQGGTNANLRTRF